MLDIEIDSYIHCISAFVKLAQSEYALLTEIIPEHHQKKTFDSLIQVSPGSGSERQCVVNVSIPFKHTVFQIIICSVQREMHHCNFELVHIFANELSYKC